MRTAKCKYCGQGRLKWINTQPPSRGVWYLADFETGERHYCPAQQRPRSEPMEAPERPVPDFDPENPPQPPQRAPEPEVEPTSEPVRVDIPKEMPIEPTARPSSIEQALQDWLKGQKTQSEVDWAAVKRLVDEAVDSRVPKPIKIKLPDESEIKIDAAHKLLPELVQAVALRFNVFLVGPAGSGKTTAAEQAAETLTLRYFEKTMGPATSQWDLLGYLSPDGAYVPGALREPYENGGLLFLDELDNSNPQTLTTLNGALANGHCQFPDKMVKRHPDFCCVAAGNTYGRGADRLYVGRQQLDAATLDRFWVIDWDYDEKAEFAWAGTDQNEWTTYVQRARAAAATLKLRVVISPRASIYGAQALRAGIKRSTVERSRLWAGISDADQKRIRESMK